MITKLTSKLAGALTLLTVLAAMCSTAPAQTTAFTYQGRLNDGANPANGSYDLSFALYDAASGGAQQGDLLTKSPTAVSNGLFTVTLDFGSQFPGADRWLEIAVRTNGGGAFATLTPRQALTPTPYAAYSGQAGAAASAASVPWAGLSGTPAGFADGVDHDTLYSNGAGLDLIGTTFSLNLDYLGGLYWKLGGNSGTPSGTQYLGVADNRPLALIANNTPLLRLEPVPGGSPNISGGTGHTLGAGIQGTTIGGGSSHTVTSDYGSIGGGVANAARAPYARVGGGILNSATGNSGVIAGGEFNTVAAGDASLVGGARNRIGTNAGFAFLGGGRDNEIADGAVNGVLAGGRNNTNRADSGVLAGGSGNLVEGAYASVLGGAANRTLGTAPTVGGGFDNRATGDYSTAPGGRGNRAAGSHSFAAGQLAEASHAGAFVWADASSGTFASTSDHQFLIRAIGGVGIGTNAPAAALHVAGTVKANVFDGSGGGLFDLSASQLTSGTVPEARLSGNVALRNASQTFTGANAFPGPGNMFTGTFTGNGASLTNINASQLSGTVPTAALNNAWQLGGNTGSAGGTHFLGTTDLQPLELKVNGQRALRVEYATNTSSGYSPNLVGGNPGNLVSNGLVGAVIGGGGSTAYPNRVGGHYATVAGGLGNTARGDTATAMGNGTVASGSGSTAMGIVTKAQGNSSTAMGNSTTASGNVATAMGIGTTASGDYSTAMGNGSLAAGNTSTALGSSTAATNDYATAMGAGTKAYGNASTALGANTTASGYISTALGQNTTASGYASTAMGSSTTADGFSSTAMGYRAKANHNGTFVWSDSVNADFASSARDQFLVRAGGGVGINKTNPATALDVNGVISGNGSGLTSLSASQLAGTVPTAALGNAWQLGGNSGTSSGTHHLGTTDNQAMEIKVNGTRAWRLEPNPNSPNLIGGSSANVVTNGNYGSVIAGGGSAGTPNRIGGSYASVLGGNGNTAGGHYSVAMGLNTKASGLYSTAMGRGTVAANDDATAMGLGCQALGWDTVAMGTYSVAGGHYSLAAGYYSQAAHQGALVWSDSSATPGATSVAMNSVTMRAEGGYRLFSNAGMTSGVSLATGGTAWAVLSDRNVKKDVAPVDGVEVLEKLAAMPVTQWRYQWENAETTPHIGPMAQDFKAAFYPGADDKSITTQEADGVALAAIQGLNRKTEARDQESEARIRKLEEENAALKQAVAEMRSLVNTMNQRLNRNSR